MELLTQAQVKPTKAKSNYRIKTCVNFIKNNKIIDSYTDKITDQYLLIKINNVLILLKSMNLKIPYAYFQKSNYCNDYGILFSLNCINQDTIQLFDNLLNDVDLKVVCYNTINSSSYTMYHTTIQRLPYKYYDFVWYVSLDSFIQVNPETSKQIHTIVDDLIIKGSELNYYGLGGEMGMYAYKYKNAYKTIKCITNSNAIYSDYKTNTSSDDCILVDYNTINLINVFTDTMNSVLLVNISRNGLRNLADQINLIKFRQIIYIGCCDKAVIRDINSLTLYRVNKINKVNQFPESCYYSYVIEFIPLT
ncbi:hypothetical protein QKU48_gp0965 [Fadolivirus algeromassiliense]|jgi:hypothetical protein|uniref:Uncharacterized protein n=1 Tax=Fadolivirus FV1/VV64 TaxID=3070911 RepID=A0A7D3QUU6_9VIRU|nr:hypothetical protein QKU48_gp0965 [Fadolivirus algeromassiliense]QKF94423.1 hypothetical protein Fadolivirus_1_965 [Fadolivirus FV1/VV64]